MCFASLGGFELGSGKRVEKHRSILRLCIAHTGDVLTNRFRGKSSSPNRASITLHAEHGAKLPTMHSTMHLYAIDGKARAVGKNDTAFSYRDANWAEVIVGVDPDPANQDIITKWCKEYFDALHPYSAGGAFT